MGQKHTSRATLWVLLSPVTGERSWMPFPSSILEAAWPVMITRVVVIVLVVFTVLFAFAVIWVAFWYHTRQEKQVRMDNEDEEGDRDGEDELGDVGFVSRPGEEDADEQREGEDVERGTRRFRRA